MSGRVFLSGAHLVLPDRIETGRTLVIEDGRIADIVAGPREVGDGETRVHLPGCFIAAGLRGRARARHRGPGRARRSGGRR